MDFGKANPSKLFCHKRESSLEFAFLKSCEAEWPQHSLRSRAKNLLLLPHPDPSGKKKKRFPTRSSNNYKHSLDRIQNLGNRSLVCRGRVWFMCIVWLYIIYEAIKFGSWLHMIMGTGVLCVCLWYMFPLILSLLLNFRKSPKKRPRHCQSLKWSLAS